MAQSIPNSSRTTQITPKATPSQAAAPPLALQDSTNSVDGLVKRFSTASLASQWELDSLKEKEREFQKKAAVNVNSGVSPLNQRKPLPQPPASSPSKSLIRSSSLISLSNDAVGPVGILKGAGRKGNGDERGIAQKKSEGSISQNPFADKPTSLQKSDCSNPTCAARLAQLETDLRRAQRTIARLEAQFPTPTSDAAPTQMSSGNQMDGVRRRASLFEKALEGVLPKSRSDPSGSLSSGSRPPTRRLNLLHTSTLTSQPQPPKDFGGSVRKQEMTLPKSKSEPEFKVPRVPVPLPQSNSYNSHRSASTFSTSSSASASQVFSPNLLRTLDDRASVTFGKSKPIGPLKIQKKNTISVKCSPEHDGPPGGPFEIVSASDVVPTESLDRNSSSNFKVAVIQRAPSAPFLIKEDRIDTPRPPSRFRPSSLILSPAASPTKAGTSSHADANINPAPSPLFASWQARAEREREEYDGPPPSPSLRVSTSSFGLERRGSVKRVPEGEEKDPFA